MSNGQNSDGQAEVQAKEKKLFLGLSAGIGCTLVAGLLLLVGVMLLGYWFFSGVLKLMVAH